MDKFDFFSNTESATQDMTMAKILKLLPLDDIKSCRLVDRKWRNWCSQDSIFKKGKLVFRSNVSPAAEVNQFLTGLDLTRLTVEFIAMNLEEIDFKNFGSKIRDLTIMNCLVPNEEVLKNMFVKTPNMNCVKLFGSEQNDYFDEMLPNVLKALAREETFFNASLKSIYSDKAINPDKRVTYKIFPSLKKFHAKPDKPFKWPFDKELRELHSRVEEIRNVFVDLDKMEFPIVSAPNLKIWIGAVEFTPMYHKDKVLNMKRALRLFGRFLTAFSRLETFELRVTFIIHSINKKEREHTNLTAKILLILIIRNCKKLRSFDMSIYERCSSKRIYQIVSVQDLNETECRELCQFVHRLESFTITEIFCDISLHKMEVEPKLKSLQLKGLPIADDNDLRSKIIKFCPTNIESLILQVDHRMESMFSSISSAFRFILGEMKNLRSFRIYFYSTGLDRGGSNLEDLDQFVLKHEKLERFEIEFASFEELLSFNNTYVEFSFKCPNLTTFHLEIGQTRSSDTSLNFPNKPSLQPNRESVRRDSFDYFRSELLDGIKKMPVGLTNIKLPDKRYSSMNIDEIEDICKIKPKLRCLEWSSLVNPSNQTLKEIFTKRCPRLSKVIVHIYCELTDPGKCRTVQYYYSRRQEKLFESELKKINGVYRPSTFRLI